MRTASGVTGAARIRAVPDGRGGTALPLLTGEGALAVRRTRTAPPGAAVTLVGAMSAPLGGDRLRVDVEVGAGARLTVGSAAATVALPGRERRPAAYDVRLTLAEDAVLHWLPEPVIAAAGSDLRMTMRAEVAPGALLVLREELVLGRHGEPPGRLVSRLTLTVDGRTVLDQELAAGRGAAPGWDGPAGLAGHRAAGQLLLVGAEGATLLPRVLTTRADAVQAAATPLAGAPATLVTALAPDARELRPLLIRTLHAALAPSPHPRPALATAP
ncbi:urease accessory protein UreD [Actinacidiphila rubida]|uniref:urease accessory protein UreD n=1 Tax=Actinacidiphila rubida TaxID=310780 RepID=UPI00094502CC|nr:urease accessory protein UreD [Actinacidiphila rubida]